MQCIFREMLNFHLEFFLALGESDVKSLFYEGSTYERVTLNLFSEQEDLKVSPFADLMTKALLSLHLLNTEGWSGRS